MKKRALTVLVTALTLVVSGGCSSPDGTNDVPVDGAPRRPSAVGSPSNLPDPAPEVAVAKDGDNPQSSNCGLDAQELGASVAVTLPDSDPPNPYGDLAVKYSPGCEAGWARVQAIRYDGIETHIWLSRPADKARTDEYVSTTAGPDAPVYSDVLSANAESCLVAHAFVVVDEVRGPEAQTDCLAP